MNNEIWKTYPANVRYEISNYGNVRDTETGKKLEIGFTPTNKQFVKMIQDDGTIHTVYMVYALALTFKGARPSPNHHAKLINPRGGYTASNVCWQSEAETNYHKIKLSQIKKILDGMSIDQLNSVLLMLQGLTDNVRDETLDIDIKMLQRLTDDIPEPERDYAPVPELPAETIAQIYIDDAPEPAPKKSIAELIAKAKKSI